MKRSSLVRLVLFLFVLSTANKVFARKDDNSPKIFNAVPADDRAILYWNIQDKITSYFVIEHSVDGTVFNSLDTIAAEENKNPAYRYTHEGAADHLVNYYRLKQLNKNGTVSYSHIRVVRFAEKAIAKVQAMPNPLTDALQLTVVNDVRLVIKNVDNKLFYKKNLRPGHYKLNTADWAPGKYDLFVFENGKLVEKNSVFKFAEVVPFKVNN